MSGIEWADEDTESPAMLRDLAVIHAVNACHYARVFSTPILRKQAIYNIRALISGDRSSVEALEQNDATIAAIELGEDL
jgi:hypothetical protein